MSLQDNEEHHVAPLTPIIRMFESACPGEEGGRSEGQGGKGAEERPKAGITLLLEGWKPSRVMHNYNGILDGDLLWDLGSAFVLLACFKDGFLQITFLCVAQP